MFLRCRPIKNLILVVFVFAGFPATVYPDVLPVWNLSEPKNSHSEYLLYKLSYNGIFTAFVWKDLADVAFQTRLSRLKFNGYRHCDLSMKVSTEKYSLAEALRPTRFDWRNKISPDLNKIYLVEKVDLNTRSEYEVTWIDWKHNKIDYFKVPEKQDDYFDTFDEEEDYYEDQTEAKDKIIIKDIPPLLYTPDLHQSRTRLELKNTIPLPDTKQILDPLSFLYVARWNDYTRKKEYTYDISYKDDIRKYALFYLGKENLILYGKSVPTLKIEAKRKNEDEAEDEGFLVMWITDTKERIPVNFIIDGTFGDVRVMINRESLHNNKMNVMCKNRK